RPERFARSGGSLDQAGQLGDPACHLVSVVLALEQRRDALERRLTRGLANDLDDRQVGSSLAVRDTAADEYARLLAEARQQLPHQPRFADAGLADDGDDPAMSVVARVDVCGVQTLELFRASDKRGIEPACV